MRRQTGLARVGILILMLALVLGCGHGAGRSMPSTAQQPQGGAAAAADTDTYVIGQSDELEVMVWQEPDLSRSAVVRADGMISLPMLNDVKADGLTVKQLRELLTEKYKELVAVPVVSVIVTKPLSATFFITGKVLKPGEYPLLKDTSILQAVATVGGFAEWAKTGDIAIIRKGGERIKVNYDAVVAGDMKQNVILQRGDTVVVP